jgi:sterol desaturase/sphingolipid hydroxylase (fatty acid hydroxylase superfamily)
MSLGTHLEINHSQEPMRLFQSDRLESLTHVHPALVPLVWLPVTLYFLGSAILAYPTSPARGVAYIPLGFLAGLFLWTLAEYSLHRFVFHFRPRTSWQQRLAFLFHGVHHAQPKLKTRLVMPPPVSIPLALIFYGAFYLLLGIALGRPHWIAPTFAGFILGYVAYDLLHYATHHLAMRQGIWKALKRHHMRHHYKTPDRRYGVTSPLWDLAFGTQPRGN